MDLICTKFNSATDEQQGPKATRSQQPGHQPRDTCWLLLLLKPCRVWVMNKRNSQETHLKIFEFEGNIIICNPPPPHTHAFKSIVESGHDYGLHTIITIRKCCLRIHVPFDIGGH